MAISEEKKLEVIRKMKEKQAIKKGAAVKEPYIDSQSNGKESHEDNNNSELNKKVAMLTAQLDEQKEKNKELSNSIKENKKSSNYAIEQNAMNDIILGNDSRFFEKSYSFPLKNVKSPYTFKVKLHMPSVLDMGKIATETSKLMQGDRSNYDGRIVDIFTAISYFRVIADDCPDWFTDPGKAYRWDIILAVFTDYVEWQESFLVPEE